MEKWMILSLMLCFFGFLKEIRPSEHYIYEYLSGPWRNLTGHEVITQVYPVGTYGYLGLLVVVFLITDLLRYKPLIVVIGLSGIIFSAMLIWTKSLIALQVVEIFYATFMAAEVAYYTYIYAKVEKEHYVVVTSHTRASLLAGRCFSSVLSQVLISFDMMDFKQLNYITLSAMIVATCWSIFIPPVEQSIYFNRPREDEVILSRQKRIHKGMALISAEIGEVFGNLYVIFWSVWYAVGLACFLQIQNYMQPLWSDILGSSGHTIYNGAVEAILTICGFFAALSTGIIHVDWSKNGGILLSIFSVAQGFIIALSAITTNIYVCYLCYIVYGIIYHFVITVTSTEIAKEVRKHTYGLIFGVNTFVAMIFQSVLTIIIVNDVFSFNLNIHQQYLVYSSLCVFLGIIYFILLIITCFRSKSGTADVTTIQHMD